MRALGIAVGCRDANRPHGDRRTSARCTAPLGELDFLNYDEAKRLIEAAGRIIVRQNVVRGVLGTPKSDKPREIPALDSRTLSIG